MSKQDGILSSVDSRTQLVGQNRLEMIVFSLNEDQYYGMNIFKVREVITYTPLTEVPKSHPAIQGVTVIRDETIPVIDLSMAIGMEPVKDYEDSKIIITEYNNSKQGFIVSNVDKIRNISWEHVKKPPQGADSICVTAHTQIDGVLVQVLDVESVMAEVFGTKIDAKLDIHSSSLDSTKSGKTMLVVDDSGIARNQIGSVIQELGFEWVSCENGAEALALLNGMIEKGQSPAEHFAAVVSDVEMPEMDGYSLVKAIKSKPELSSMKVVIHTSLSSVNDSEMVKKTNADAFLSKFDSVELTRVLSELTAD